MMDEASFVYKLTENQSWNRQHLVSDSKGKIIIWGCRLRELRLNISSFHIKLQITSMFW